MTPAGGSAPVVSGQGSPAGGTDPWHDCTMLATAMGLHCVRTALDRIPRPDGPGWPGRLPESEVTGLRVAALGMLGLLALAPPARSPATRQATTDRARVASACAQAYVALVRALQIGQAVADQAAAAALLHVGGMLRGLLGTGRDSGQELAERRRQLAASRTVADGPWDHWMAVSSAATAVMHVEGVGGGAAALQRTAGGVTGSTPGLRRVLAELDGLVGMEPVKRQVRTLVNLLQVRRARAARGLPVDAMSQHMVFLGAPGTGKTTVARLIARVFRELGLLERGHLVETDRGGLVGEYVGQTAPRTAAVLDEARSGILFIDEAYALTSRGERDFGHEAVETLLKRMEDERDQLVVVVAGYSSEMRRFLRTNPGLESRFTHTIDFPNFGLLELFTILRQRITESGYRLDPAAHPTVTETLRSMLERADERFGNARSVRNMVEQMIANHADRVAGRLGTGDGADPEREEALLTLLTARDVPGSTTAALGGSTSQHSTPGRDTPPGTGQGLVRGGDR